MLRLSKHEAAHFTNTLQYPFIENEMRPLIAAHAAVGRLLCPLCHMLGMVNPPVRTTLPTPGAPYAAARNTFTLIS